MKIIDEVQDEDWGWRLEKEIKGEDWEWRLRMKIINKV